MVLGVDLFAIAVVVVLMVACGAGIGRLLWLIEGRPHLDRPSWWPGTAVAEPAAPSPAPAAPTTSTRAAGAAACAVCCGVPMLLVIGILGVGAAATLSLVVAALLAVALLAWAVATGRASHWRRMWSRDHHSC